MRVTGRAMGIIAMACFVPGAIGCRDLSGLTGKQALPAGVSDPNTLKTPAGALQMYTAALYTFQPGGGSGASDAGNREGAFVDFVLASGQLTDELTSSQIGGSPLQYSGTSPAILDVRQLPEQTNPASEDVLGLATQVYKELQAVRRTTNQAIGALATYAPALDPALRGQMYTLQGYAEILLADLYCSGVPLSTLDFQGDFTYRAGSTTTQVYQDAAAKLDTAVALSADSAQVLNLARVGLGRALLALGQYTRAAQVVASVPDTFTFRFNVDWHARCCGGGNNLFQVLQMTVSDSEGETGVPFISSDDPRSTVVANGSNQFGKPLTFPAKYGDPNAISTITVADGIEARLIEAEAALHSGGDWLTPLNTARALAAPSLTPLADPGTDTGRVRLLFRERAYDLFVTGHRQGDLRRLIRQYGRSQGQVYPIGPYPTGLPPLYGTDVTVPIPPTEFYNPLFTGCLDRRG